MQHVAILGAGELGGALAHIAARRGTARSVTLIDDAGRVAEGKALDIAQAAPVERFATHIAGTTDLSAAAGAAVVVLADRASGLEWQGDEAVQLLKQIGRSLAGAVAICAGAQQRDVVERAVLDLKMSRVRVFGTAPEALASAARAIVALALNGSPQEISLALLGVPPHHIVIPWEDATAGGLALTRLVDEPTRRRLSARIAALWPPGPHTLAAAAWLALEAMAGRSRRMSSAFVAPDATAGLRARTSALPVRIGRSGIVEVIAPRLTAVERVAFDNATLL